MTTATFQIAARPRTSKQPRFLAAIVRALDAYATLRMQKAVSECEFRRVELEIKRYSRIIESGAAAQNA